MQSAATFRDILGKDRFFLELQWHGIEDQKIVNRLAPIAREPGWAWSPPTTSTTCNRAITSPTTSCCASTASSVHDKDRLRYHGDQFYLKTGDEMAHVFGTEFPKRSRIRFESPSAATSISARPKTTSRLRRARGLHPRCYFEHMVRQASPSDAATARDGVRLLSSPRSRRARTPARVRDRHDQEDSYAGIS
jgi:hypothetical protein